MDILLVKVIEHHAAIFMIVTDIYIFTLEKLTENTASNFAKVACDNIIEVEGCMPVSVKNVLMVEKAAGAMAAPMLLASLTPKSTIFPIVQPLM